tara:strand:- start:25437 stop:25736 length:300 start_codon:yes stop_codon:yes gene_type:complete
MKLILVLVATFVMSGCEVYYTPPRAHTYTPKPQISVVEYCSTFVDDLECACLEYYNEWYEAEDCWDYYYYSDEHCFVECVWIYNEYYDEYEQLCWEVCY